MSTFKKEYRAIKGLDSLSNNLTRSDEMASDWLNVCHLEDGTLSKREGGKPVAPDKGGLGLFVHRKRDPDTSIETVELLTIDRDGEIYRAVELTWTVSYSGAATAVTLNYYYDNTVSAYRFRIVVDGASLISTTVGKGTDEGVSFPINPLSTLDTTVEALTGISTELDGSGSSTTSAAFLFPHYFEHDLKTTPAVFSTYVWEEVNSVYTGAFADLAAEMESSNFELVDSAAWDALTYFAHPQKGILKYDGQTLYLAGMPSPEVLIGVEVNATGVAEVSKVYCTDDNPQPAIVTVKFDNPSTWDNADLKNAIKIYDSAGSVGVYYRSTHTPTGVDRALLVSGVYGTSPTNAQMATATASAVNADAQFIATVDPSDPTRVIIEDIANGSRTAPSIIPTGGALPEPELFELAILQAGDGGYHGTYFLLSGAAGRYAIWFDVDNTGTLAEPAHGMALSSRMGTITSGMTAAQVAAVLDTFLSAGDWTATSSGSEVTVTDAAAGTREDIASGTAPLTVEVNTQGTNAGLGQGDFIYHYQYQHVDNQGIFTEGAPSDDLELTLSAGSKNVSLTIPTIQSDSGYNTGCAIVNGAQTAGNTLTVDSGHTMLAGDKALIKTTATAARAEITTITTVADTAASLDAKYFYLFSSLLGAESAVAFWIDVDNNGTAEPAHGADTSVEITTITSGMTAPQVATAIAAVINARSEWNASAVGNVITVTDQVPGLRTDAYDGNTTFTFAVTTQGANATVGEVTLRNVTATASTTITVDGDPVSVSDNAVISAGLSILIWRTELGGPSISKFFVDELPNNSFVGSVTYVDSQVDADLDEDWVEPEFTHGPPPKCRYITVWGKILVVGGAPTAPSTIYHSIPGEFSPEYFPPDTNQFPLYSNFGDQIRGLYALSDGVLVFKDRSFFPITGDVFSNSIRVDKRTQFDIEFLSQRSLVEAGGQVFYADSEGVFNLDLSSQPSEASKVVGPSITGSMESVTKRRSVGFYDRRRFRLLHQFPVFEESVAGDLVCDASSSVLAVYNALHNSWYIWDEMDISGGIVEFDGGVFFQGWKANTAGDRTHHLYRIHDEEASPYIYEDHDAAISASFATNWYRESSASTYKSFTFAKFYAEADLDSVTASTTFTTERHPLVGTAHTSYTWNSVTGPQMKIRLRPSKVKRLRYTFSNSSHNSNMLLTGWDVLGKESDRKEDLES